MRLHFAIVFLIAAASPSLALAEDVTAKTADEPVIDLGDKRDQVRFTFRDAPWPEVLAQFADWSELTLDLTDAPDGDFSYYDNRSHSISEAIDILNGYLLPRGFVLLRRDQFLVCLKTDNPALQNLIPTVEVDELSRYGENDLLRIIVAVEEIDATTAAEEVADVLGPFGRTTALESSRSVMLQGFGSGLRRALDILRISRPPVTDDKLDFRSYSIKHLPVADAEMQIRNLFGVAGPGTAINVSGARSDIERQRYYRDRRGRGDRDDDERSAPPIPLLKKVAMNMQVSSLDQTNTLLVTATPEGLALVEEVLESIDVPDENLATEWAKRSEPDLRVYGMVSADEGEVAKTIDVLMPGVIVNEDRRQDTIHVFADAQQHREVERLIRILDINEGGSRDVEVIPLRRSNPAAAANFLRELFANADRDERPTIQAELASRSIIVRGTENQVSEVRQALVKLGEPGVARSAMTRQTGIRRVRVGDDRAERIADSTRRLFGGDDDDDGSIRVVVPGTERASTQNAQDKEAQAVSLHLDESAGSQKAWPGTTSRQTLGGRGFIDRDMRSSKGTTTFAVKTIADDGRVNSRAATNSPPAGSSVRVEVEGDDIVVSSGDPAAAQAVEEVIRELARQMPSRKSWTVFYLRVAEVQKAATQLTQLINDPSAMISATGVFLADTSSETLRIVTDKRTNSLLVNGTESQLAEVEKFLEIIDATVVPGSFIDRKPHAIEVQHADVNEIADLLRTLYKDYLVDPVLERAKASRSDQGRRGNDDDDRDRPMATVASTDESPGVRLTLAVDERTREILVACNDLLFEEIQTVVRQRDQAASENQPVVQVVNLSPGIETEVLQALQVLGDSVETGELSNEPRSNRDRGGTRRSDEPNRRNRNEL